MDALKKVVFLSLRFSSFGPFNVAFPPLVFRKASVSWTLCGEVVPYLESKLILRSFLEQFYSDETKQFIQRLASRFFICINDYKSLLTTHLNSMTPVQDVRGIMGLVHKGAQYSDRSRMRKIYEGGVGPWSMWDANSATGFQFPSCARSRMLTLGKLANLNHSITVASS